jgi:hypothetical protein
MDLLFTLNFVHYLLTVKTEFVSEKHKRDVAEQKDMNRRQAFTELHIPLVGTMFVYSEMNYVYVSASYVLFEFQAG